MDFLYITGKNGKQKFNKKKEGGIMKGRGI